MRLCAGMCRPIRRQPQTDGFVEKAGRTEEEEGSKFLMTK